MIEAQENKSQNVIPFLRLDQEDNVLIAKEDITKGTIAPQWGGELREDVSKGHKIASTFIAKNAPVKKYNTIIGYATQDIQPGMWVHSHNMELGNSTKDYRFGEDYVQADLIPSAQRAQFQGIVRKDGQIGTRNHIGIFITVNCSATVARKLSAYFDEERLAAYPQVDGVTAFVHHQGCGMEMTGEPMDLLRRTLSGYIRHPNIAGAVVLSLGCERNNVKRFMEQESLEAGKMLHVITMQDVGGTMSAFDLGKKAIWSMLEEANKIERQPCSAEHIKVGLQCGGSDGFSALSANPALGKAVDILVRHGGTAILSETPELYGMEHTLSARARTKEVGQKFIDRMNWWLEYNEGRDTQINGRVSPGNHAGGIANIVEKSLGGAKKGGSTGVNEVYEYAYPVTEHGLVIMDTPGYDPVSATGQIAGGANIICFTTGRGSCFGSYPAPTIKLASHTGLYERMTGDMDINCGQVIDGQKNLDEMGEEIFAKILDIASGTASKSEAIGVGEDEFVPWQIGVLA